MALLVDNLKDFASKYKFYRSHFLFGFSKSYRTDVPIRADKKL